MPKKLEIKEKTPDEYFRRGSLLKIFGRNSIKEEISDDMKVKYKKFKKLNRSFDLKKRITAKKMNNFRTNRSFQNI